VSGMNPTDLVNALVLESGRRWGDVAADFQHADVAAIFDPDGPRWHFLTRPRGGSKSTDLAAVLLAWLVTEAAAGERGYVIATDKEQGSFAVLDAIAGLIRRTPELRGLVEIQSTRVIATSGASVEVLSADGASTWGLRPSFVVADEAAQWPATRNSKQVWSALISSLGKVPGCRLVVLTSAGEPSHWSRKVLIEARSSDRWRTAEIPGPLPWADPANLAAQRRLMRESEYMRLHLNQWTDSEDRLVTEADLLAAARDDDEALEPVPGKRYVITVDLGLKNDRTIAVVAHSEPVSDEWGSSRRIIVARIAKWRGTRLRPVDLTEVETWLQDASTRYNRAKLIVDPWQATGLCQRLQRRGIPVEEFTFSSTSVGRIANALFLALRGHLISLPNDPDLLDELGRVRLKETTPGVVRLDHDSGQHDDQAVAIGLACVTLTSQPGRAGMILHTDEEWAHRDMLQARATGQVPQAVKPMGSGLGAPDWSTGLARPDDEDQSLNGQTVQSPYA
jgi:phage terminase large subunit-like protein